MRWPQPLPALRNWEAASRFVFTDAIRVASFVLDSRVPLPFSGVLRPSGCTFWSLHPQGKWNCELPNHICSLKIVSVKICQEGALERRLGAREKAPSFPLNSWAQVSLTIELHRLESLSNAILTLFTELVQVHYAQTLPCTCCARLREKGKISRMY
jgi:hypothetical protein